jgi:hypothetical protein
MAKRPMSRVGSVQPSKQAATATATSAAPTAAAPRINVTLSHKQIAERAYYIWLRRGRPHGQELQNWREAEADLVGQKKA